MLGAGTPSAGAIIVTIIAALGLAWVFRVLLISVLRVKHPDQFAALGSPTPRQLSSLLPKHQNLYLAIWKYIWGGQAFRLKSPLVSALSVASLASDIVLVGSVALLFWTVRQ